MTIRKIPTSALSAGALLALALACSSSDDPAPGGGGGDAGDAAAGTGGTGTGGSGAGGAAGTPATGGAAGTPATGGTGGGTGGTGAAGSAGDLDAGADATTNGDDVSADAAMDGSEPDAAGEPADAGADGDPEPTYLDFAGCTHAAATDETGESTVTIDVNHNFYAPPCVRVSVGTTVEWVGNSGTHPLISMSANGDTWADPISSGTDHTISRTMSTVGSFGYFCSVHGSDTASSGQMTGVVYVEAD